jgi:hypothetical protein
MLKNLKYSSVERGEEGEEGSVSVGSYVRETATIGQVKGHSTQWGTR